MPRKSLRPNLNQIRAWVRQGRTDAWVAHQLEVSVRDIEQFKRQNDLIEEDATESAAASDYPDEIDLRAEDDALIAAELEAAEVEAERARAKPTRRPIATPRRVRTRRAHAPAAGARAAGAGSSDRAPPPPTRARWRQRSTTARRATACGWTRRSRTTRSTPSIGPDTGPSRSPSRRTASSSAASARTPRPSSGRACRCG